MTSAIRRASDAATPAPDSRFERLSLALMIIRSNRLTMLGALLTLFFFVLGGVGFAVLITPELNHLYARQDLMSALQFPLSPGYPLGTDNLGRDMLWRTAAGVGVSLSIGVSVTFFSLVIGMVMGAVAGYYGGLIDQIIGGLIDLTWGFPLLLVAVIIAGMFEPGVAAIIASVSLVNWAGFARIIRAQALSLRQREFVEAARALGIADWKIIARHIIPHTIGTTLVMASYYIAVTVIVEAGLSFIGLGAQPPLPSLGQMIATGRNYLSVNIWVAVTPGVTIALIVLGLNTLGDGLRDILDPRLGR